MEGGYKKKKWVTDVKEKNLMLKTVLDIQRHRKANERDLS